MVDARGRVVATVFAARPAAAPAAATASPTRSSSATSSRAGDGSGVHRALRRLSYPAASMGKTLVIAEKPSVGQDLARVLPGPFQKHTGAGEQDRALARGPRPHHHLGRRPPRPARRARRVRRQVQEVADGRPADRPARFKLVVRDERSQKQMTVVRDAAAPRRRRPRRQRLRRRPRGRADLRLRVREGRSQEARRAAVAELDDRTRRCARPSATCAPARAAPLEEAARSRSEADWIVGMNATRAATIRLRSSFDGAVSLGRVQTPTLAILDPARGGDPRLQARDVLARRRAPSRADERARATRAASTPARKPRLAERRGGRGDRRGGARASGRDHQAREDQAHREGAAALRPHVAAARGQHALRLLARAARSAPRSAATRSTRRSPIRARARAS